jgi:hypothetical protein
MAESKDPKTFLEALRSRDGPYWLDSQETEYERLGIRATWEIQEAFRGLEALDPHRPIKSKMAFRKTLKANGDFKFRSRLVGCGYSQIYGKDYDENFSPTAKYKSLCIILHLCAIYGWNMMGIDVENAFIEPKIDKEIYMYLPKDVYMNPQSGRRVKVKLLKSLYGLKQAGDLWNKLIDGLFKDMKYYRLAHDLCVYIYHDEAGDLIITIIYVDDILFFGPNLKLIDSHIQYLIDHITKLTIDDKVTRYIGVDIERDLDNHTIKISQKPYTEEYVSSNVPGGLSIKELPLPPSVDYEEQTKGTEPPIMKEVGQLRYLADRTKIEIQAAVGTLGSAAANPSKEHVKGVTHIGQYLKGTIGDGVTFGGSDKNVLLFGYCDASYEPRHRSRLGFDWFLNLESGAIAGRSTLDPNVTHSSCESEISGIDIAVREAIYLRGFLKELDHEQTKPTVLYTDSKSAKQLIELFHVGSNSAHLVMRLNFLHEQTQRGIIELRYINTDDQVADIQTKLLALPKFKKFKDIILSGHKGRTPLSVKAIIPEPNRSKTLRNILKWRLKQRVITPKK